MTIASTPEPGPREQPAATVIPFPVIPFPARLASVTARRTPAVSAADQDRLRQALQSLNDALADQRTALKAWRAAMGELKASTMALEENLQRYRGNLRSLGSSVAALRDQAQALEAWADKAGAKPG